MAPLPGSADDARRLGALLNTHANGAPNYDVDLLISTVSPVSTEFFRDTLFKNLNANLDEVLIYFSGHAGIASSGTYFQLSSRDRGLSFQEVMSGIEKSAVQKITIMLDCCFAGGIGDLGFSSRSFSILKSGLTIFASSSASAPSLQQKGRGAFTETLIKGLKGGAASVEGKIYHSSLFTYIGTLSGTFLNKPVLKSYAEGMSVIRETTPRVHPIELRLLDTYFKYSDEYELDSSYDKNTDPRNFDKERILSQLLSYHNAGLIEPDGAIHIHEAIQMGRGCKLTSLGIYYRELVRKQLI